jgi:hypothetical protein
MLLCASARCHSLGLPALTWAVCLGLTPSPFGAESQQTRLPMCSACKSRGLSGSPDSYGPAVPLVLGLRRSPSHSFECPASGRGLSLEIAAKSACSSKLRSLRRGLRLGRWFACVVGASVGQLAPRPSSPAALPTPPPAPCQPVCARPAAGARQRRARAGIPKSMIGGHIPLLCKISLSY